MAVKPRYQTALSQMGCCDGQKIDELEQRIVALEDKQLTKDDFAEVELKSFDNQETVATYLKFKE